LRQVTAAGQEADRRSWVYICDECIDLCNEIIDEELTAPPTFDMTPAEPKEIYGVLNELRRGAGQAKRTLSVAVYNHTSACR